MTEHPRPRLLCMTDLSHLPEARAIIEAVADVEYAQADHGRLVERIGAFDVYWGHVDVKVDRAVLEHATRLRVINVAATGTDHIDKVEAARRGIRVLCIAKDLGLLDTFTATAECAWMLILACCRRLREADAAVTQGRWPGGDLAGVQLSRKTLGVLGVGRLGRMVVEYGKAFRMRVLGCDLKPFAIPGVEAVPLETLLRESDVVTIHIHMEPRNYHLFNRATLAAMKPGAVLVNTSRGDIVDEAALLAALESGHLAGCGADVLHNEWRADMRESPVVAYAATHPNVVITPHLGGATAESIRDARVFSARKLAHFLCAGEELTRP